MGIRLLHDANHVKPLAEIIFEAYVCDRNEKATHLLAGDRGAAGGIL